MTSPDRAALADELEPRFRDLKARLLRCITTATNDDISEPMSEKRLRHTERVSAMYVAMDFIDFALRSPSPYSGADFTDQLHARAECIRATNFVHIGEQDARDFADLFDKAASAIKDLTAQLGSYKKREDDRDDDLL